MEKLEINSTLSKSTEMKKHKVFSGVKSSCLFTPVHFHYYIYIYIFTHTH